MIVEFYGVSGVGKSILAAAVRRLVNDRGPSFVAVGAKVPYGGHLPPFDQWIQFALSLAKHPVTVTALAFRLVTLALAGSVARRDVRPHARLIVKWWKRLAIYITTVRRLTASGKLYLFERGIATNLLSLLVRLDSEKIAPLHGILAASGVLADLVVVIEAGFDTVKSRRRGRRSPDKAWMTDQESEWRKFALIKELAERSASEGPGRVLTVNADADADLEANSERVYQEITKALAAAPARVERVPERRHRITAR